ncbi:FabD/lysophospholipase-like protein, partial [Aureobasidium melanogenum]
SATQNEVSADEAEALISQGAKFIAEGSNMGCTQEAIDIFEASRKEKKGSAIWYAPGKAANAGGVAVSGLEMAQNSQRLKWTTEEVDEKLKQIMKNCFENGLETAKEYVTPAEGEFPSLVAGSNIAGFKKVAQAMHDQGDWWKYTSRPTRPKTALFFPGQGVQRVGMLDPWLSAFPSTVKPILEEIDHTLAISPSLTSLITSGTNAELTATQNAQPAIMATSILILRVLEKEFGFNTKETVDVTLGHSLGEFAALVAAGNLQFTSALKMVRRRGEVMAHCSASTEAEMGMIALVCEPDQRDATLDAITRHLSQNPDLRANVANINSKTQFVLSGDIAHINTVLKHISQFDSHDPRAVRLKADSPFHSPLMQPTVDLMQKLLRQPNAVTFDDSTLPCISNITAKPFSSAEELIDLVARSAAEPVLWHQSIVYLHQQEKVKRWIGIGPGKVGRNLVGKEVGMKGIGVKGGGVLALTDPKELEEFMKALEDTDKAVDEDVE